MALRLDETIRAVYFLSGRDQDWMAAVNEPTAGTFDMTMRFRYYDPDDPGNDAWSGQDRKQWRRVLGTPGSPTLDEAIGALHGVMTTMQDMGFSPSGGIACEHLRGSMTLREYMDEFRKLPFVSAITLNAGETLPESDGEGPAQ